MSLQEYQNVKPDPLFIELGHAYGMTGYSPAGSAVERVKKTVQVQGQEAAEEDRED